MRAVSMPPAVHALWRALAGNPVASGSLAVLVGGAGIALLRAGSRIAWAAILAKAVVRAEFDSRDDSYRWLVAWLADHPHLAGSRRFSVLTSLRRIGASAMEADCAGTQPARSAGVLLIPAGASLLRHAGRWLLLQRSREDDAQNGVRERLTLYMLGGNVDALLALITEARDRFQELERARTAVYFIDEYGSWTRVSSKPARPASSVVLGRPDQVDELLADCRRFLEAERWYCERGIPYRRGYLFHGPPGTGKTSLVAAVASELGLPIYVVSLASGRLTDQTFAEALACAAPRCILLLEDVDSGFVGRSMQSSAADKGTVDAVGARGGLTFSGLLNAIDGVGAQEGRMLFLTTNHPDVLDPALVRPGRVDVRLAFSLCTAQQVRHYCQHFYGETLTERDELALASAVPSNYVSVAQLQGALMQHPNDPAAAASLCRALFSATPRPSPVSPAVTIGGGARAKPPAADDPCNRTSSHLPPAGETEGKWESMQGQEPQRSSQPITLRSAPPPPVPPHSAHSDLLPSTTPRLWQDLDSLRLDLERSASPDQHVLVTRDMLGRVGGQTAAHGPVNVTGLENEWMPDDCELDAATLARDAATLARKWEELRGGEGGEGAGVQDGLAAHMRPDAEGAVTDMGNGSNGQQGGDESEALLAPHLSPHFSLSLPLLPAANEQAANQETLLAEKAVRAAVVSAHSPHGNPTSLASVSRSLSLKIGDRVTIGGLEGMPQHNEKAGTVAGFLTASGVVMQDKMSLMLDSPPVHSGDVKWEGFITLSPMEPSNLLVMLNVDNEGIVRLKPCNLKRRSPTLQAKSQAVPQDPTPGNVC